MTKIVLVGGHLTPALALIEELKGKKEIQLLFFGRKYATEGSSVISNEYKQIKNKKIKFYNLTAGRLQRRFTKYTLTALLKLPIGFIQSFINLILERPKLIVSFGGYLSVPIVFCGWLLGIRAISHEQAVVPGLATKINSLFVEKVFLSFDQTKSFFDSKKAEVIGNLVPKSIYNKKIKSANIVKFVGKSQKLLLILGGNQGSHVLNQLTFELVPKLKNYIVLHQVGSTNWKGDLDKAKSIKSKNYLPQEYINPEEIGAVLSRADVVISRSGANTVWDLAVLKKRAILVPIPKSSGAEQQKNAQILSGVGLALIINQDDLTVEKVQKAIKTLYLQEPASQKKIDQFVQSLPQDAGAKMTKYILELIKDA